MNRPEFVMFTGCNRAVAALLTLLLCSCASAGARFDGQWSYQQTCGWNHTANLNLVGAGKSYTGSWDDGTRVRGESGQLKGEVDGDKLMLRLCTQRDDNPCSDFGDVSHYVIREQSTLVWYRKSGSDSKPYLTLHESKPGQKVPTDDQCEDDEAKDDDPKDN